MVTVQLWYSGPKVSAEVSKSFTQSVNVVKGKAPTRWRRNRGGAGDFVIRPEARHYGHWSALAAKE